MFFAKIVINRYYTNPEKYELVFRPLIREYEKRGVKVLMERGNALLIGVVDSDGIFHERFTGCKIEYDGYQEMDMGDFAEIMRGLSDRDIEMIKNAINKVISKKDNGIAWEDTVTGLPVYDSHEIFDDQPYYPNKEKGIEWEDTTTGLPVYHSLNDKEENSEVLNQPQPNIEKDDIALEDTTTGLPVYDMDKVHEYEDMLYDKSAYKSGKTQIPVFDKVGTYLGANFFYKCKMLNEIRKIEKRKSK